MPLTRPFLDMIDGKNIINDPNLTVLENNIVVHDKGEYSLLSKFEQQTFSKILSISYDEQAGILYIVFTNGKILKARGFPTTFRLSEGKKGPQGDKGRSGRSDIDGRDGETGASGCSGDPGSQGSVGERGVNGDDGEEGDRGDTGDTGDIGDQGPRGDRGLIAQRGPKGLKGLTGKSGTVNVVISNTDPGASIGPLGLWIQPGFEVTETDVSPISVAPIIVTTTTARATCTTERPTTPRTTPVPITAPPPTTAPTTPPTTAPTTAPTTSKATTAPVPTSKYIYETECVFAGGVRADNVCSSRESQNSDGPTNGNFSCIPDQNGTAGGAIVFGQDMSFIFTKLLPTDLIKKAVLKVVAKRGSLTTATFNGFSAFSQSAPTDLFFATGASSSLTETFAEYSAEASWESYDFYTGISGEKMLNCYVRSKFKRSSLVASVLPDSPYGIWIDSYQLCLTFRRKIMS